MQRIIIDGYNVVFTDDRMRKAAIRDRQSGRGLLIQALREYVEQRDVQVTLVFDGRGHMADAEAVLPGRLQIVYSARGQTADELILQTLREADRPQSYLVVTSDRRDIGGEASAMGARVIGSKRFLDQLADDPAQEPPAAEKPDPDADDTDYWISQFERDDP